MKYTAILLLFIAMHAQGQYKFLDNTSSNQYEAKIFVANCENGLCGGKGTIILYDKISGAELQTFNSPDLQFSLTEKQDAKLGWLPLGKYQSPLIFGDFNFDGHEDIAIRNGSKGAYDSPSYNIYTAASATKFNIDTRLSELASNNLGMFAVDKKNQRISIMEKSGCCYQKTISYKQDSKKQWFVIESVIEDSSIGDEVVVITQKLINGKMQKTVEKFKTKDYYEN